MSDSGLVRHSRKKNYGYKGIEKGNKVKILVCNIINKLHGEKVAEWKVLWIRCCVCVMWANDGGIWWNGRSLRVCMCGLRPLNFIHQYKRRWKKMNQLHGILLWRKWTWLLFSFIISICFQWCARIQNTTMLDGLPQSTNELSEDAFISFFPYFCVYTSNKFNYRNSKAF